MKKLISLLAGAFLFAAHANAAVVIARDRGGFIDESLHKYEVIRASGEQVIVAGECSSACTTVLGIIPDSKICATPGGVFGFHSGMVMLPGQPWSARYSPYWTQVMWRQYPERVRNLLRSRGWNGGPHPSLIMIRATDIVQPCQGSATQEEHDQLTTPKGSLMSVGPGIWVRMLASLKVCDSAFAECDCEGCG